MVIAAILTRIMELGMGTLSSLDGDLALATRRPGRRQSIAAILEEKKKVLRYFMI